jgi:hypothetical protein
MALKRTCPVCETELVYSNLPGFRRATRTKALCRRCAASPAVIQKRLAEAEKRAAEKPVGNFLAAFFSKIEQGLSGSHVRNSFCGEEGHSGSGDPK